MTSTAIAIEGDGKENKISSAKIITGKIIDSKSKEEISGAEIIIGDKKVYSDFSGNFSLIIPIETTEATIKFISYKDSKIKINPYSYNTLVVEITAQ